VFVYVNMPQANGAVYSSFLCSRWRETLHIARRRTVNAAVSMRKTLTLDVINTILVRRYQ